MSDSWKDCEGQVVDGRFTLVEHLGGSDHSVVFSTQRGKDKPEKVAIKFIQADPANSELQLARWKQAAQISHPHLIKLFETGRCHLAGMDLFYVVMEYAQENLAQFLPERALSPAETRDMLEPFLETLAHVHGKGFAHGRIKPGNILAIDDQLKLSTDSLARIGEATPAAGKANTYAAPESANGASSAAGDVWALGITLFEALTQRIPERNGNEEILIPDSIAQPFRDIIGRSLRLDPKARCTIAEISACLNPAKAPPPPKVSAPAIPDPIKPVVKSPAGAMTASAAAPAIKPATPVKPAASVDPLSVPLSTVAPLPPSRQRSLENQMIGSGSSSNRSYYIVVGVLVAMTLGAMLAIPRFRDRHPDTDTLSTPAQPAVQSAISVSPTKIEPPAAATPEPKSQQKLSAQVQDLSAAAAAQRPDQHAPQSAPQNSLSTASAKEFVKTEAAPAAQPKVAAPLKAASGAPAGPVTQGEVLNQILPEVSAKSRSTIHGTVRVVVKVHVDASGTVTGVEPASSPSRFFGDAATQAARRWDFAPAKIGGQPVPSEWLVRFDFTQSGTKVLPSQTTP